MGKHRFGTPREGGEPRRGTFTGRWYHGDTSRRDTFVGHKMDRDAGQDTNAVGPGIYFTRDRAQARGYAGRGGWLYTAKVTRTARVLPEAFRPRVDLIARFIALAPAESRYYGSTNWAESQDAGERAAAEAYSNEASLASALMGVYNDFYGHDYDRYAKAMVELGYDALLHRLPDVDHLVVYNPDIIVVEEQEEVA